METLNKRNTEALSAKVEELNQRCYQMQEIIARQHTALVGLQERLNVLEQQLIIQKVQLTGLGPSVRG
jgi:hypothetical protein